MAVAEPAVGDGDGGVEFVVELAEDGDEAGVVGGGFLGREGASGAEGFEDVIHRGERKAGVLRLHPLAARVQFLPQGPDARLWRFVARGEGKRVEVAGPSMLVKL